MLWGTDNILKLHVYLCPWQARMGGVMHFLISKCHGTCMIDCLQRRSKISFHVQATWLPAYSGNYSFVFLIVLMDQSHAKICSMHRVFKLFPAICSGFSSRFNSKWSYLSSNHLNMGWNPQQGMCHCGLVSLLLRKHYKENNHKQCGRTVLLGKS